MARKTAGVSGALIAALFILFAVDAAASTAYVGVAHANVRKGPGTSYAIVGVLSKGTTVNVVTRSGNWRQISSPINGWVSRTNLRSSLGAGTGGPLVITFIDVGQGDSELIRSPGGKSVLIDAGDAHGGAAVLNTLSKIGAASLDLVYMTHPHDDHIGGMKAVLAQFLPGLFFDPAFPNPTKTYDALLAYVKDRGIPYKVARRGQQTDIGGGVTLLALAPELPFLKGTRSDPNSNSIILRLTYNQFTALFTGDSEVETEQRLLASGQALSATVLKVAHHGSRYASTDAFLHAVAPKVGIISCGTGNVYGHPHAEALARLAAAGVKVHRTDLEGTITLTTHGGDPMVQSERSPPVAAAK